MGDGSLLPRPVTPSSRKPHVNLVVIGHRGAGKSTLSGHFLSLAPGALDPKVVERVAQEAAASQRPEAKYAWLLDKLKAERSRGTIEIALRKFETRRIEWTLIDAPGHRDYIKNMITGTSQADIALLVVSADAGFEAGMAPDDGQTREHALLARTLGVSQVVVAVSQMDRASLAPWSAERFAEISRQVRAHLNEVGFSAEMVRCLPVSGFQGANLVAPSEDLRWFDGPTLMEVLDASRIPERPVNKPLRLAIQDVYKVAGVGTVPVGRIESGVLKPGMRVRFGPPAVEAAVMSVEMHHVKLAQAGPGDIVGLCVRVPEKSLKRGMVCSLAGEAPARACVQFRAQVIVFDQPAEIKVGYTTTLDVHTAHVPCRFAEIECRLARDGSVTEKRPESIRAGDGAIVVLEPLQGVVVETFEDCPPLGRFALRDSQKTVAVGVIKEVTKVDAPEANPVLRGEAPASHLRPPSPRMVPVVRSRGYPADPPAPKPRRSRGPSKNGPEERSKRTEDDEREREDSPEGQSERRRSRKDDSNSRSTRDTSADGADERDREV